MTKLLPGWHRLPFMCFAKWHLVFNNGGRAESICNQVDMSGLKITQLDHKSVSHKNNNCVECQRILAELREVC